MFQSGIGFRNINLKGYHHKEIKLVNSVDEAVIKVESELIWLWVAIDSKNKQILAQNISQERNMFVAERFLSNIIREYGKHLVSTDGGTWYPQPCNF